MTIEQFIINLSSIQSTPSFCNPYINQIQSNNLNLYLSYMQNVNPKHLLIGEAPGYRGCALTGVPFTDEYRIANSRNFGYNPLQNCEYKILSKTPHKEISASVIWESFVANSYFPLLWNIFPFHPHLVGNINTNRTPTTSEIKEFIYFVRDLISIFPTIQQVYALGKKAEGMLIDMEIPVFYIRHPANGGATRCREQIQKLVC